MKVKHVNRVFILCNQVGRYSIWIIRGRKKRNYYVDPKNCILDWLSDIGNHNNEFRMTIEMSIFPTISIVRRK